MESVEGYLDDLHVKYKESWESEGKHVKCKCPACGKKNLSINCTNWLFKCFSASCGISGGRKALKEAFGDKAVSIGFKPNFERYSKSQQETFHRKSFGSLSYLQWARDLQLSESHKIGRKYLDHRGISLSTAEKLSLGHTFEHPNTGKTSSSLKPGKIGYLTIPYVQDGKCKLLKFRALSKKAKVRYGKITGGESLLYKPGGLDPESTLVIVGGEIDAISIYQSGWTNVVSGCNGEGAWSDNWTEELREFKNIVILFDSDEAGAKSSKKVAYHLGEYRCRYASYPDGYNDANEWMLDNLSSWTRDRVEAVILDAKPASDSGIVILKDHKADFMAQLTVGKDAKGKTTGWACLDDVIGGWRSGEITIVTGGTGCGKTAFTGQAALYYGCHHGPVMYCPFEMKTNQQIKRFICNITRKPFSELSVDEVSKAYDFMCSLNIMVYDPKSYDVKTLIRSMKYSVEVLGIELLVVDHVNWVVPDSVEASSKMNELCQGISEVVKTNNISCIIVAHPKKKGGFRKDSDNGIFQLDDIKSSSSISQIADNVLSAWRPRDDERATSYLEGGLGQGVIYSLKQRDNEAREGSVPFCFDPRSSLFLDLEIPKINTEEAFFSNEPLSNLKVEIRRWLKSNKGSTALDYEDSF